MARGKFKVILVALLFAAALVVPICTGSAGAVPAGWTSDVIATGVFAQAHGAYDSAGHLHLVVQNYGTDHLYYYTNASGSFVAEDLGYVNSYHCALALDSDDKAHIAYHEQSSDDVIYINNVEGEWTSVTVDSTGDSVWSVDIAVDSNARAHIVCEILSAEFQPETHYHTNASGAWVHRTVSNATVTEGGRCSIALDGSDAPHVVFVSNEQLMHATRSGESWSIDRLDEVGDVMGNNDVAIDGAGTVYVVYFVSKSSTNYLYFASGSGSVWSNQLVAQPRHLGENFNDIVIDSSGRPQVSYFNYISAGPTFQAYLASLDTTWSSTLIAEPATSPSIVAGSGGELCIIYLDDVADELRYASTVLEAPDPPSAPLGLSAVGGVGQIDLAWSAPADNGGAPVTTYKVYRSQNSGSYGSSLATVTSLSYEDTAVTNGQKYYYTVTALNSAGEGPNSTEASATPHALGTAPGKVTNLKAYWAGDDVALTWTPPSDGGSPLLGYAIFRSQQSTTPGSGAEPLAEIWPGLPTYLDHTAVEGQDYYYWVAAWNGVGDGQLSDSAFTGKATSGALDIVLVAVIAIVILAVAALAVLFFLRKRR